MHSKMSENCTQWGLLKDAIINILKKTSFGNTIFIINQLILLYIIIMYICV